MRFVVALSASPGPSHMPTKWPHSIPLHPQDDRLEQNYDRTVEFLTRRGLLSVDEESGTVQLSSTFPFFFFFLLWPLKPPP